MKLKPGDRVYNEFIGYGTIIPEPKGIKDDPHFPRILWDDNAEFGYSSKESRCLIFALCYVKDIDKRF